jgi:hypothetical protein
MPGQENNICHMIITIVSRRNSWLFEGKLKGKIVHFRIKKVLDLTAEEAQYF